MPRLHWSQISVPYRAFARWIRVSLWNERLAGRSCSGCTNALGRSTLFLVFVQSLAHEERYVKAENRAGTLLSTSAYSYSSSVFFESRQLFSSQSSIHPEGIGPGRAGYVEHGTRSGIRQSSSDFPDDCMKDLQCSILPLHPIYRNDHTTRAKCIFRKSCVEEEELMH
ncbi:hypothetical protein F5880DRAFT_1240163 [Lentinula raphanica]|nr:hypothetical protein F5880DRAFT_1240163 [Lentinula raphanica]